MSNKNNTTSVCGNKTIEIIKILKIMIMIIIVIIISN